LHLGYLAATLEQHGHQARLLDLNIVGDEIEAFKRELADSTPSVVGISATTASFPQATHLAQWSKETLPDSVVVLGGCHVTFTAAQTLADTPAVDMVVRGEGEQTLRELVDCLAADQPPTGVLGLSYRQNGHIIHNPPRPFIRDLNALPWPARHLMDMPLYSVPGALISSRGCPGRCIFCAAGAMGGQRYRIRSPESVVDEMEFLHRQYGLEQLSIMDDTFTGLPRKLTLPVCAELERRGLKIAFGCESRADVATPQLLETLRKAGCTTIQFGVESGSPRILATLGKRITLDQVRQATTHSVELGMRVICSFILGHPNETEQDVYMTLDFIEELLYIGVREIYITPLIPYPGSDVYERRETYGITLHANDWSQFSFGVPVISTRHLSRDQLREFYVEANVRIAKCSATIAESQKGQI